MAVKNKVANIDSEGILTIKNKTDFRMDNEGNLIAEGKLAHRFFLDEEGVLKKRKSVRK